MKITELWYILDKLSIMESENVLNESVFYI